MNEVGSLKQMLDEFSKFARMPAPHMTMSSLDDVIKEVVALYQGAHREIDCVVELDQDLPSFNFDREQIKRVLGQSMR